VGFICRCNRQLASADLLRRPSDVTRSMVQKAVVVIASQPIFVSPAATSGGSESNADLSFAGSYAVRSPLSLLCDESQRNWAEEIGISSAW
jgi:hypothetical protein